MTKQISYGDWMLQKDCKNCNGTGRVVVKALVKGKFVPFVKSTCEECNGTGKENHLRVPSA